MSASSPLDLLTNDWALSTSRALSTVVTAEVSPYLYPPFAAGQFKRVLDRHVDFDHIPRLVADRREATPLLLVGAIDVRSGKFEVFRNGWDTKKNEPVLNVTADAILASAAIPTLFRAVHIVDRTRGRRVLGRPVLPEPSRARSSRCRPRPDLGRADKPVSAPVRADVDGRHP